MRKTAYFTLFVICLIAVYFSARRSPLFCLILTFLLLYLPLKFPQIVLVFCFFAASYAFVDSATGKGFLNSLPDSYMNIGLKGCSDWCREEKKHLYSDRQKIWNIYLDTFYQKPVMDEGLAAVQRITKNSESKLEGFSAHNTFIGLLSETGLSGTLLMCIVLLRSILFAGEIKNAAWRKIYIILFIPTLLINWVEYNLIPGQIFFLYTMIIWLLPRGLQYIKI